MTFEKFYESLREGKSLTNNNGLTYVRIEDGRPVEADHSENIDGQSMATGDVGRVKEDNGDGIREKTPEEAKGAFKSANVTYGDGRTEGVLTGGNPMQFSLSGLDKCVTAGDGGIYYVGDLFDKGNGKSNGKQ